MSRVVSERERRARERVDKEGRVNWLAVGPQINALRLAERERREEAVAAEENMRRIAELDRANMAKRELKEPAAQVPAIETDASVKTNIAIDKANRRRQKSRPPNPLHPIYQEVMAERKLERELNPKSRKPAGEDWREKLTSGPHWQDALKWFRMTPAEKAAAEAAIADAMNTEIGAAAQALAGQTEWNKLEESGAAEQLDFSGFYWPTDEK